MSLSSPSPLTLAVAGGALVSNAYDTGAGAVAELYQGPGDPGGPGGQDRGGPLGRGLQTGGTEVPNTF